MSTEWSKPLRISLKTTESDRRSGESQSRAFELLSVFLGLSVLAPFWVVIGLLIKLESPGPVFFRQTRVGKDEKLFDIIKFRSMRVQPCGENTVAEVKNIETYQFRPVGETTIIGRALRACSLDEVPNLLNVIRGDLHLVGPRPDEPELVSQYRPEWRRRHNVKPGITGLAQINGRTDLTYQEMMTYDLAYVANRSFTRDVGIMLETVSVVLRRKGAR